MVGGGGRGEKNIIFVPVQKKKKMVKKNAEKGATLNAIFPWKHFVKNNFDFCNEKNQTI